MIVWLDLETTGLDPSRDEILELGVIVTDDSLNEIARRNWVFYFDGEFVSSMNEFVREIHTNNGLLAECQESIDLPRFSERAVVEWLEENGITAGEVPLAGNTIGFDRSFLRVWMPSLLRHFHYLSIDMSSVNELARRWAPAFYESRPQDKAHRALADLDGSIALARHYRGLFS